MYEVRPPGLGALEAALYLTGGERRGKAGERRLDVLRGGQYDRAPPSDDPMTPDRKPDTPAHPEDSQADVSGAADGASGASRRASGGGQTRKQKIGARHFINRELSLLEFNRRVLAQAQDASLPLLERLRFLAICSSNLDEFFEIRVAGLKEKITHDLAWSGPDRTKPRTILDQLSQRAHELVAGQYRVLHEDLRPALRKKGIVLHEPEEWTKRQKTWARQYFRDEVQPVLTPIGLDPAHPFPRVLNKGLSFLVQLEGKDAYGRSSGVAIVQVPRSLPRVVRVPQVLARRPYTFTLLTSMIQSHVQELFPGMQVAGCYQFRITRNSDLWVDEEEVENLLNALKGELPNRRFGEAVRLEIFEDCPEDMITFLLEQTRLTPIDCYRVRGPVNLHRLSAIHDHVDRDDLKFEPFLPGVPKRLKRQNDVFEVMRRRDVLLHHPYEQFTPVVELVRQAAQDPSVLAIKMTLYRVGESSPVVEALHDAARAGKQVTALVELRARFDEAANIDLATELQELGVNVVYGIVGFKAHTKLLMIVRREREGLRRYVHLGTGNYHSGTTKAYTDFGLMTVDKDIGEDVHQIFMQLTGLGRASSLRKILQSPFTLLKSMLKAIRFEAKEAKAGRPAWIRAKMNSLSEPRVIRELYRASRAGVKIDLVIRGICVLRPGVAGISENIRVRSVVGRFLEHHRIFAFHGAGDERVYLSSADWMSRNLKRRVEQAFPVEDEKLKARVIREGLDIYWQDNCQAWDLQSHGLYRRAKMVSGEPVFSAQAALLAEYAD